MFKLPTVSAFHASEVMNQPSTFPIVRDGSHYETLSPIKKPTTKFESEAERGWYSPQQFVASSSFPYFINASQQNVIPVQHQHPHHCPEDNYIPNSSPMLADIIRNISPQENMVKQYSVAAGSEYYVKATMRCHQMSPMQRKQKAKRYRTAFTTDQILALEEIYGRQMYVSKAERESLTARLGLTDRAIKVWFQNRRMKGKRDLQDNFETSSETSPSINFEEIQNQMQQCEVVDDYVSVPPELCDKLGELINQCVSEELIDSSLDSSSLGSCASMLGSVSITPGDVSSGTSLESSNDSHSMDDDCQVDVKGECSVTYEPISPAEGLPIELPTWKPQDPEEMKLLFERHFC